MKRIRISWILVGMAIILIMTGCAVQWVVKVNGEAVRKAEFDTRLKESQAAYEAQGVDFSGENGAQYVAQLKTSVIGMIVQTKCVAQEVKRLKLDNNTEKIQQAIEEMKAQFSGQEAFAEALKIQGFTEEELRNMQALYEEITKEVAVSDSDVQTFFKTNSDQYDQAEQVKARHILVATEEEANAVISRLDQGEDFADLAKELSLDTASKDSGGELDYFTADIMDEEFSNAAFSQAAGVYSKSPVQTIYGYHIILVEDHRAAETAEFAQIQDQVAEDALDQAKGEVFNVYMMNLSNSAKIEYGKGYDPNSQ
ncbi:MAG: peptidylprolyl isomerase [Peptococcaceae bacterium]|jgi:peptidyl-prolyl cis-trans isomerase C|nr:peptidylprolyl isomerase [Peptococcaceae bacterium]